MGTAEKTASSRYLAEGGEARWAQRRSFGSYLCVQSERRTRHAESSLWKEEDEGVSTACGPKSLLGQSPGNRALGIKRGANLWRKRSCCPCCKQEDGHACVCACVCGGDIRAKQPDVERTSGLEGMGIGGKGKVLAWGWGGLELFFPA